HFAERAAELPVPARPARTDLVRVLARDIAGGFRQCAVRIERERRADAELAIDRVREVAIGAVVGVDARDGHRAEAGAVRELADDARDGVVLRRYGRTFGRPIQIVGLDVEYADGQTGDAACESAACDDRDRGAIGNADATAEEQ